MSSISAEAAVRNFIARINAHDSHGVAASCTPDHLFIDSLGTRLSDLAKLETGWAGYFTLFPDYRIEVDTMISDGALVLLSGWASATHRPTGRRWRITAAWRAVVAEHLVAEWQVYADNKPVYEILSIEECP
jgi:ketosteroid isomerase-like protein